MQNIHDFTFEEIFDDIGPGLGDTIRHCSNAGFNCENITQIQSGMFSKCFVYDIKQQVPISDEGLSNGLNLIFMTGGNLASQAFLQYSNEVWIYTGFQNAFRPYSADGMRIMINSPGEKPDATEQGINISPGYSTLIALTGKETIRKPWPYSNCVNSNHEVQLLHMIVMKRLGYEEKDIIHGPESIYTKQQCQSACLNRLVLEQCDCLQPELKHTFPNVEKSRLCGTLGTAETQIVLNLEQHNKSDCVINATALISDRCNFIHKLINDMACVKKVKQQFTADKLSNTLNCQCPPVCYSYEYIVSISQSQWPTAGPETNEAYRRLIYSSEHDFEGFLNVNEFYGPQNDSNSGNEANSGDYGNSGSEVSSGDDLDSGLDYDPVEEVRYDSESQKGPLR